MRINKSFFIPIIFTSMLCDVVASGVNDSPVVNAEPDHILSGNLIGGGVWELKVYCYHGNSSGESIHGTLSVDGIMQGAIEGGEVIKATLGELKHFGKKGNEAKVVTGWYFTGWPQTCSYLPK